jgi:UbiD family decarboxylase
LTPTASMNPDLRTFLSGYEAAHPDDVLHVATEVDRDFDITAWVLELDRLDRSPLLVFESIRGHSGRIVANTFGTRQRIARMLETEPSNLAACWDALTEHLIPPVLVPSGASQEIVYEAARANVVDVMPTGQHFVGDAGQYITSGVCVSPDPDTGITNLTFARIWLKSPRRFGVSFHSRGHHWDYLRRYEERGQNMPMAVFIGAHPLVYMGASARVGIDVDEYAICGALLRQPVELVNCLTLAGVQVPATAEFVIEGEVLAGVREPEGPFGEYTGYSTTRSTNNVFTVSAISTRRDPIYLDVTPGYSSEHLLLGRVSKEASVLARLRQVYPSVRSLHYPKSGTHFHCYLSIAKRFEGEPRQIGLLLLGLDPYVKLVVVLDSDVDPAEEERVLWAMATRMQAHRDVLIVPDGLTNQLDPSSRGGVSDKMIIDATMPPDWDAHPAVVDPEARARARAALGFAAATVR